MAKKSGGPNKSQAIRDFYAANPEAKPKAVVEALAGQGIEVSAAFVSTIKSTSVGKTFKGARRGPKPKIAKAAPSVKAASVSTKAPRAAAAPTLSIDSLVKAKGLVRDLGGIENAMNALAALKKLAD